MKDFVAGVMFIGLAAFFSILATNYQMGTPARMGSGYFPFWLGIVLGLLGLYVLIKSINFKPDPDSVTEGIGNWDWKSVLWVTGSVTLFGIALPYAGLVISVVVLVFVSAMASYEFHWKGTLVSAIILNVFTYIAFVWGLKLQFPVWPNF